MAVGKMERVEITSYSGLTVEFCKKMGVKFIIRGLRTTTDFELETVISQANARISPEILTIFIPAGNDSSFISSTVVRDVIENGGDASPFLPAGVDLNSII